MLGPDTVFQMELSKVKENSLDCPHRVLSVENQTREPFHALNRNVGMERLRIGLKTKT